jgi:hypothetical protein
LAGETAVLGENLPVLFYYVRAYSVGKRTLVSDIHAKISNVQIFIFR